MKRWRRDDGWPPPAPTLADPVARAVWQACLCELAAIKPGNVGLHADGHDMRVEDFVASAASVAPLLARRSLRVGERVLEATRASLARVGCNTNLGIVLLAAPLAVAAQTRRPGQTLRGRLRGVLRELDVDDTRNVFAAIRLASPAGLGSSAEHDVRREPRTGLLQVMRAARRRDQIARQYANDFRDVFTVGLRELDRLLAAGHDEEWAATGVYLAYLSRSPDTHICRKLGLPLAREVRRQAIGLRKRYLHRSSRAEIEAALLDVDGELKLGGINPGTSADLTVATLLARRLRDDNPQAPDIRSGGARNHGQDKQGVRRRIAGG